VYTISKSSAFSKWDFLDSLSVLPNDYCLIALMYHAANGFCRRLAMKVVPKLHNFLIHVFRNKDVLQYLIYWFLLFIFQVSTICWWHMMINQPLPYVYFPLRQVQIVNLSHFLEKLRYVYFLLLLLHMMWKKEREKIVEITYLKMVYVWV